MEGLEGCAVAVHAAKCAQEAVQACGNSAALGNAASGCLHFPDT